ncbi:MAG: hypothetical protein OXN90_12400 [Gemmatimonadota bacterium]|nr:hypothetical protein [Gemmatimonadota bacterium]
MRSQAIWHPAALAIYIRLEFHLTSAAAKGLLRCAASGPYEVYLNGERVGRGVGPAVAEVAMWEQFALDAALREGENLLLVFALGSGTADWFRAEGKIERSDGAEQVLYTGPPWQVRPADAWQDAASYAAVLAPTEWPKGKFAGWREAAVVAGAEPRDWSPLPAAESMVWAREVAAFGEVASEGALEWVAFPEAMQTAKCVRREAFLTGGKTHSLVQATDAARAAYIVLDFGRLLRGFPHLRLRGQFGAVIDLGFARAAGAVESRLRYVCRDGLQEWTAPQLATCRYLVVRIGSCPEDMEIDSVALVERRVVVEPRGRFTTVGEDWERLWGTGEQTLAASRQEVYALGEERLNWDQLYVWAMNDLYVTGSVDTARAVLAGSKVPLGGVQAYFHTLLVELVQRHDVDRFPAVSLAVLVSTLQMADDETILMTAPIALRTGAWLAVAAMYRRIGDRQHAAQYERVHHRARKALQAAWSEKQGLFADVVGADDYSRWTNALVLYFALANPKQQARVAEHLSGGWASEGDLWQAFFVAGALWRAGADAAALAYVQKKWGRLLARPGWTWGEKTGSVAAQPGPESLLAAHVLGVAPKAEGILEIRPQLSGLERAEGIVPTPHGDVEVAWGAYGGGFSARLAVPHDGETHLSVPRCDKRFPQIEINGETVWRNEKAHPNFHVQELISQEKRVVMVLRRAGQYEVSVE